MGVARMYRAHSVCRGKRHTECAEYIPNATVIDWPVPTRHPEGRHCARAPQNAMRWRGLLLGMLCGAWVLCVGCSGDSPSLKMPPLDPAAIAQAAVSRYDANGDGKLDAKELEASPALGALLRAVKSRDAGHPDSLAAEDIAARVEAWKQSGSVLLGGRCKVTLDGKRLAGAVVTWEPEPYLGPSYRPLSGTSTDHGYTYLAPALEGIQGIYPGLYTVRISKKVQGKETLPARYNEQSTLGREIAADVPDVEQLFNFELKSK